jgi:hypothetical protein
MNKISEALLKLFAKHRIVFWYDEKDELLEQFQELSLDSVSKVHVQANQFAVKHLVSKVKPNDKFLLYFTNEKPAFEDNWLLDLELAHHVFHTDQEAMWLQEIGLGYHLKELVTQHMEFFRAKERRIKLKDYLGEGDEYPEIRYKMLAILFGTENINLLTYIHAHASGFSDGNDKYEKDLERYGLTSYYWGEIKRKFGYTNDTPSIYDFLIEVFNSNFSFGTTNKISKESKLLISLWKDSTLYKDYFGKISDKISNDLDIENKLNQTTLESIIGDDIFKMVDQRIIHELVHLIIAEGISSDNVSQFVKQRENKFWYNSDFEPFYQCILFASQLISGAKKHGNKTYSTLEAVSYTHLRAHETN